VIVLAYEPKDLKEDFWKFKDLKISVGKIVEKEEWEEPMGPKPKPNITDLRSWDFKLLERYKPFYAPFCDMCCMCTFGKCDLTGKKGACGIEIDAHQARLFLLACCIGTSNHGAHARHLLDYLLKKHGEEFPIDLGMNIDIEAPIIRTIIGKKPKKLGDLAEVLNYCEEQLMNLLSSTAMGQEGNTLDFESKSLHAGMIDNLAKEVCDIAQIVTYEMPKGDEDVPLVELGLGVVDKEKPTVLCIGHNIAPGAEIIDYIESEGLYESVEVCGVCCSALDVSRHDKHAKIVGPISKQLKFIRSGVADVIVIDEQCIRTDVVEEALKNKAVVIATTDKSCQGLPDKTNEDSDKIVSELVKGRVDGVLILDPEKVGEVAVKAALKVSKNRRNIKALPTLKEVIEQAGDCIQCGWCERVCPSGFPVYDAVQSAREGELSKITNLDDLCYSCGRCEEECRAELPLVSMITRTGNYYLKNQKYKMLTGRGPIQDVEIRKVGAPIVFGEIPGVIAFAGCTNYPKSSSELAEMAEELLKRNYIVVAAGCAAMSIGEYKDEEGESLYEKYGGSFEAGGLVNLGSCVSNAHAVGACIKIANIFAKRPLRGNYEEIADYILNRIGACGVAFGAYSQKAAAISAGLNRWGIPVILGPHGTKYKRLLLGRKDQKDSWKLNDFRTGEVVDGEPAPEHLIYAAETKEEVISLIPKFCIRPNDTPKGRQIKLNNYIDLYNKYLGAFPDDIHLFVRKESDIPIKYKKQLMEILASKGWEPREFIAEPSLRDLEGGSDK
jgi:acetyl-CoA decarbonylase/synthase complex subunit alpha